MSKYKITVLPGDGIGVDVVNCAKRVLDASGFSNNVEYLTGEIGWEFWKSEGIALPKRTIDLLKESKCSLFGAITSKPKEEADAELDSKLKDKKLVYFSPIVALRQLFDLYVNLRPCKAYKGNPLNYRDDINLIIFRENTEGLYAGVEWHPVPQEVMETLTKHHSKAKRFSSEKLEDLAISTRIFTRKGCQRIINKSFEYAKEYGFKNVTVVEKPNVIRETSGLMVREARKIAKNFPGIDLWETNVDAMAMWLIKNPQNYSVMVSSNMFGDIISDLSAQLVGGLGFACAGNIGDNFAVFEPTHGSAPKYIGMNKVNPIAAILSAKMMLEWLNEKEFAFMIESAVTEVILDGKVRTYDMGGNTSTTGMADAIIAKMKPLAKK
ncbi:MAG: isocitrate/isopropylmalate dehydrogenase family protein [Candidatus Thorarchaeota archaeon]